MFVVIIFVKVQKVFFNCKEDCGKFSVDTLLDNCIDGDITTPCFWNQSIAWLMLFGGGAMILALSTVKFKVNGEKGEISPYSYVKLKYKKRKRRR